MFNEPRKVMRLPQVMAVTGWSRSTVYDKIKAGKFPKPFKPDPDGRVAGWFEDEIAELSAPSHRAQCKGRVIRDLPGKA